MVGRLDHHERQRPARRVGCTAAAGRSTGWSACVVADSGGRAAVRRRDRLAARGDARPCTAASRRRSMPARAGTTRGVPPPAATVRSSPPAPDRRATRRRATSAASPAGAAVTGAVPGTQRRRRPWRSPSASANAIRSPSGDHAGVPTTPVDERQVEPEHAAAAARRRTPTRVRSGAHASCVVAGSSATRARVAAVDGASAIAAVARLTMRRKPIRRAVGRPPGFDVARRVDRERQRGAAAGDDVEDHDPAGVREREPVAVRRPGRAR